MLRIAGIIYFFRFFQPTFLCNLKVIFTEISLLVTNKISQQAKLYVFLGPTYINASKHNSYMSNYLLVIFTASI